MRKCDGEIVGGFIKTNTTEVMYARRWKIGELINYSSLYID